MCSLLSPGAIAVTAKMGFELYEFAIKTDFFDVKQVSLVIVGCLYLSVLISAWILYFKIGYRWSKSRVISPKLKRSGFIFGFLSICLVLVIGAVLAAPAIFLMLYINQSTAPVKSNLINPNSFTELISILSLFSVLPLIQLIKKIMLR